MIIIDAPHFCCGILIEDGRVTVTAPIVGWMKGKTLGEVKSYCARKGWHVTMMDERDVGPREEPAARRSRRA